MRENESLGSRADPARACSTAAASAIFAICSDKGIYGREIPLATIVGEDVVAPVKWLRKQLAQKSLTKALFDETVLPLLPEFTGGGVSEIVTRAGTDLRAASIFPQVQVTAILDSLGRALLDPPEREAIPPVCRDCSELQHDLTVAITNSPAYAWRQLGLVSSGRNADAPRSCLFLFPWRRRSRDCRRARG